MKGLNATVRKCDGWIVRQQTVKICPLFFKQLSHEAVIMIAGFPFIIVNLQTNLECGCCPQPNICHIQTCELCLKMFKFNRTLSTESAYLCLFPCSKLQLGFPYCEKKIEQVISTPCHERQRSLKDSSHVKSIGKTFCKERALFVAYSL